MWMVVKNFISLFLILYATLEANPQTIKSDMVLSLKDSSDTTQQILEKDPPLKTMENDSTKKVKDSLTPSGPTQKKGPANDSIIPITQDSTINSDSIPPSPSLTPSDSLRERLILELRKIADLAFREENWKDALDNYKRYIQQTQSDKIQDSTWFRYLFCLSEIGAPEDPEGQEELVYLLPRFEKLKETMDKDSLDLVKARFLINLNRGASLWSRKKYLKESFSILTELKGKDPFYRQSVLLLTKWHFELSEYREFFLKIMGFGTGHYKKAVLLLEEAKERYPKDCEISYYSALAYTKANRIPEAVIEFKRLQKLPGKDENDLKYKQMAIPYLLNLIY